MTPSNEVATGIVTLFRAAIAASPKNDPVTIRASVPVVALYWISRSIRAASSSSSAVPAFRSRYSDPSSR